MNQITIDQINQMLSEQDSKVANFYKYPDENWQISFQEDWMAEHNCAPLAHSDGSLAATCPCCGHPWDKDHAPQKETRGWDSQKNLPAWAWTCTQCLDEEQN